MKAALVVVLFAAFSSAQAAPPQTQSPLAPAEAACGPMDIQFDAHPAESQPLPQPDPNKSLVYVIEVFDRAPNQYGRPTLRVGLDGKWAGAVKGDTYLAFSVHPGQHHLCTSWQSRLKQFSTKVAFTGLNAEPGKIYYLRARIIDGGLNSALDFAPVDADEAHYLIAKSAPSNSRAKTDKHKSPQDQSSGKGD
jgi:hypothetical protein